MSLSDVIKKGSGAPEPADLIRGGIGVDTVGKKMYFKGEDDSIVPVDSPSFRNKLINGNFDRWDYGNTSTTTGYVAANRWMRNGIAGDVTFSKTTLAPGQAYGTTKPLYMARWNQTVASANWLTQRIEGVKTLSGKKATVSFWANTLSGGGMGSIRFRQHFGTGGSPSAFVDVTAQDLPLAYVAGAPVKHSYTFDIPSVAGKTLGTDGNDYLELFLVFPVAVGDYVFSEMQVEEGSAATPFEERPLAIETMLCQRYYETNTNDGSILFSGDVTSGSSYRAAGRFKVDKRAAPSIVLTSVGNTGFAASGGTVSADVDGFFETRAATATIAGGLFRTTYTASAEL